MTPGRGRSVLVQLGGLEASTTQALKKLDYFLAADLPL